MTSAIADDLDQLLSGSPYVAYSYAYPHKTAYRPLPEPMPLWDVWEHEPQQSLFLYLHVPFCEYRCGFCNLFTLSQPEDSLTGRYLAALAREASAIQEALHQPQFVRMAIGGGTPTFLSTAELDQLFRLVESLGVTPRAIPGSCEASPATITSEKLALLRERGVDRLSLGIQSFSDEDSHAMGRPQSRGEVERALSFLKDADFPSVNLDLIYGGRSQTQDSWLATIDEAVAFSPEEIYLYPLYVRPLTGLAGGKSWDDWRLKLYQAGRERLLEQGYRQVSLRMFCRDSAPAAEPVYCCQDDGMIGLGCGARSYTRSLHYSREYAVKSSAVAGILADYVRRTERDFAQVEYGIPLDSDEQRRRLLILSLLQASGLDRRHYSRRFSSDVLGDFPQLLGLVDRNLATIDDLRLQLTPQGLEWSDAIGPWLYSAAVTQRMEEYAWR